VDRYRKVTCDCQGCGSASLPSRRINSNPILQPASTAPCPDNLLYSCCGPASFAATTNDTNDTN